MAELSDTFAAAAGAWTLPELVAVLLAIAYLLLAIRQNLWCWPAAAASTAIYVWLFIDARLYMESVLNLFYFGMAAYGWYSWRRGGPRGRELPVVRWPLRRHATAITALAGLALLNGWALATWSDAAWPYVDSLTTWAAIWTTFLVARKVLENWWYWFAIDAVSVVIYWSRELPLTALLFVLYLCMIPFGLRNWTRSYRERDGA